MTSVVKIVEGRIYAEILEKLLKKANPYTSHTKVVP